MTAEPADLARIALIALMAALGALVLRLGIRRHQGAEQQLLLPWWGAIGWMAFIAVSATGQATRLHEGALSWRWWMLLVGTVVSLAAVFRVIRRRPGTVDTPDQVPSGLPTTRLGWVQLALWVVLPAVLAWSFVSFVDGLQRQACRDSVQARGEIRGAVSVAVDEVVLRTQDAPTRAALAELPRQVDARVREVYAPVPPCADRYDLDVEPPTLDDVLEDNGADLPPTTATSTPAS